MNIRRGLKYVRRFFFFVFFLSFLFVCLFVCLFCFALFVFALFCFVSGLVFFWCVFFCFLFLFLFFVCFDVLFWCKFGQRKRKRPGRSLVFFRKEVLPPYHKSQSVCSASLCCPAFPIPKMLVGLAECQLDLSRGYHGSLMEGCHVRAAGDIMVARWKVVVYVQQGISWELDG